MFSRYCLWAICGILSMRVFAVDLIDVYRDALHADPVFQTAYANRLSQKEVMPQAIADVLPDLGAAGTLQTNRETLTAAGLPAAFRHQAFGSHDYSLSVTQPVFNFSRWTRLLEANNTVKQAEATFNAAEQNLMIRTAGAYFAVLEASDTLRFTESEKKANAKQLEEATQRYRVGVDPITSVNDAKARYDAVVAREIAAQNALINAKESLAEITGRRYDTFLRVDNKRLPLVKPSPQRVDVWVDKATQQNYSLLAAKFAAESARQHIKTAAGNHLPTVNVVASYEGTKGPSFSSGQSLTSFKTQNKALGVQVALPIFQGGKVLSQTRQASYDYQASAAERQRVYRSVVSQTHQSYNNVIAGISQVKADRQAIISAQSSYDSLKASYQVGTRTLLDVLNAQKDLFDAYRQSAKDQYSYINSILQLKQAAGTLSEQDLLEINGWLKEIK